MSEIEKFQDAEAHPDRIEYIIYGENPHSVENLVEHAPMFLGSMLRIREENPELLTTDEGTFKKMISPTLTLNRLRMSFWQEYENSVQRNRSMRLGQVYGGICTERYFSEVIMTNNKKLGYLLCPPTNYVVQVKEALYAGLETLRDIVSARVIDDDGFLIPRAADVVIKAVALLDMRVKGAVVQKVDQRTLNYNLSRTVLPPSDGRDSPMTMEELDALLDKTRQKLIDVSTYGTSSKEPTIHDIEKARERVHVDVEQTNHDIKRRIIK